MVLNGSPGGELPSKKDSARGERRSIVSGKIQRTAALKKYNESEKGKIQNSTNAVNTNTARWAAIYSKLISEEGKDYNVFKQNNKLCIKLSFGKSTVVPLPDISREISWYISKLSY
ncbi:hypothetical protein GEMRC1_010314 [Eukaryota sp. GEM-RC1]